MKFLVIAAAILTAISLYSAEPASALTKKPEQVTVIKAESTYDSVTLTWKKSANASSYIIYRSDNRFGLYKQIDSVDTNSYTDEQLQTGQAFWYKIRAVGDGRWARKSPRISAVTTLETPQLKTKATGEGVYLTVSKVPGASGYVLYRDGKSLGVQNSGKYLDDEVYAGKSHGYKAVAYRYVAGRKIVASDVSREVHAKRLNLSLRLLGSNTKEITELYKGQTFEMKGTIKSNAAIEKVTLGVATQDGDEWVDGHKYVNSQVDNRVFDITEAGEKINLDELEQGSYSLKVMAKLKSGKEKVLQSQEFEVIQPPGGIMIAEKALECAWPFGTSRSKCRYPSGVRTDEYTEALSIAYGSRSGWSRQTKAGASCDVFVGTVVRSCGYDEHFPRGLDDVEGYCANHPEKWENLGAISQSEMQPGDVVYQIFNSGVGHISIYVGDGHVANAHYIGKSYGIVEKASSKIKSAGRCRDFNVYRAIQ